MRWIEQAGWMLALACTASPAMARAPVSTRLVHCGAQSCLLVSGYRRDPAANLRINGHGVSVEGGRHWHLRLPVETVRAWSPPLARALAITMVDTQGGETGQRVDLPIGLLGHADLALLTTGQR